ncbi:efflux RND transporter periplasmic adaptor subunit [Vibrio sp. JC009]|uniref:efflux RND transporter periplasmic adaptor subunit n=1 Tax=Vibrio sp. JC009 TaxID=2912314 RepID=UPI0023B1DB3D|nr:efflux RND transporter periplasmic adaptor subunit [Vibrio sp. JC009]WED24399.1 efflux RND transporter periplasmic adaptor subunit [Vibrio sp. JC009]
MNLKKLFPVVLSLSLLLCAGVLVIALEPTPDTPIQKEAVKQPVTVTRTVPRAYTPDIRLLGTTSVRWPVQIKAPAGSKLVWLNPQSEPGTLFRKGDVLAKLDTTHLKSQQAQAYSAVKQAELNLERELHEQTVALKMLSQKNSSAYARREPQIASAKAQLQQARETYKSASQHMKDAIIVAPFDAVVLARTVGPGQQVEPGENMFKLASSTSLDVHMPVSEQEWADINAALNSPRIQVTDKLGKKYAASVRYISPQANNTSRQRQIVLAVNDPFQTSPHLLPNQQVTVEIGLSPYNQVSRIPQSALTRDGQVWTLDRKDKLCLENIRLIKENRDHAYVIFDHNPDQPRLVVSYPLLSMIAGIEVSPELSTDTLVKNKEHNQ